MKIYVDGSHPPEGFMLDDIIQHRESRAYLVVETLAGGNMVRGLELKDDLTTTGAVVVLPRSHSWLIARRCEVTKSYLESSPTFLQDFSHGALDKLLDGMAAARAEKNGGDSEELRDLEKRLIARALYAESFGEEWHKGPHGEQLLQSIKDLAKRHKAGGK